MKKYIYSITVLAAMAVALSSCTKDLDTVPKTDQQITQDQAWSHWENYPQALAKVYAGLSVSGQEGPAGKPDISGIDEGFSTFTRGLFHCQELTTDEAICNWNDPGVPDMHNLSWSSSNSLVSAMYDRIFYTVTVANNFLRETTPEKLEARGFASKAAEVESMRAEARWVRAYVYWLGIDMFGNIPYVDENTGVGTSLDKAPKQKNRIEMFNYVEQELVALTTALPADGNRDYYGRATQGAAWALLSRLYLNGEIYTGKPYYKESVEASQKVLGSTYSLDPVYVNMFLADNHTSPEFIFAVPFDSEMAKTYGGSSFFIQAATGGQMDRTYMGLGGWAGVRTTKQFYKSFESGDTRAQFFTQGQTEDIPTNSKFEEGVAVTKWRNVNSDGSPVLGADGKAAGFADNDVALFRLGEIYLNYAEAVLRGNGAAGSKSQALLYLNQLRSRAYGLGKGQIADYDLNFMIKERGREMYWELQRRTDLIRFGLLTTDAYIWQWKGGVPEGQPVSPIYNVFPLSAADVSANPNLTQNTGY